MQEKETALPQGKTIADEIAGQLAEKLFAATEIPEGANRQDCQDSFTCGSYTCQQTTHDCPDDFYCTSTFTDDQCNDHFKCGSNTEFKCSGTYNE